MDDEEREDREECVEFIELIGDEGATGALIANMRGYEEDDVCVCVYFCE
jgi:hypothetical protein